MWIKMTLDTLIYKGNVPVGSMEKEKVHAAARHAFEDSQPQPFSHEHIGVVLMKSGGKVLTSIRGYEAESNPDQTDKSIGGHVQAGFEPETAILATAAREFEVPIAIVSQRELEQIIVQHPELLRKQAFIFQLDFDSDFKSKRRDGKGGEWVEECKQNFYLGAYNGAYNCMGTSGVRGFALEDFAKYATTHPERVTGDLQDILARYGHSMQRLSETLDKKRAENPEELVEVLSPDGGFIATAPRKTAHHQMQEAYLSNIPQPNKHAHIGGVLVDLKGQICTQIRGKEKAENPGKYDKLFGGHIPAGDTPIIAAYHEAIEEMGIPLGIFDEPIWRNILTEFPECTLHQAICQKPVEVKDFASMRERADGRSFLEICDQHFIVGRYHGSFEFVDREAQGVYIFRDREEMKNEMAAHPEQFTSDLKYIVKRFWDELVPLDQRLGAQTYNP